MSERKSKRLLAQYGGGRPEKPDWYSRLAIEPEQVLYPEVDGAKIEVLTWGEAGKPGVLLAHGNRAHARWWGPVAPLLARDYRVASLSWSGMGGSEWRDAYSLDQFADEMFAAAEAGGLFAAGAPVFVGHSFGTRPLVQAVADRGNELAGAILVDGVVVSKRRPPIPDTISDPRYESMAAALARFSLLPDQECDNHFILDDIARACIEEVSDGWRWRFDPAFYRKLAFTDVWTSAHSARCPLAVIFGEDSGVLTPEEQESQREGLPEGTPCVAIPNAGHHIMADQPIALTAALRALIAQWLP